MLVHLLRSHPEILCHGEVFGPDRIGHLVGRYGQARVDDEQLDALLWEQRINSPQDFLDGVVFDAQGHMAVGFKFKTDEAFADAGRDIMKLVAADTSIRVIRLRRRDLLAQYVSHQVVLHQQVRTLRLEGDDLAKVEPFNPVPGSVVEYLRDVLRRERLADDAYAAHPQHPVWYEDLMLESVQHDLAAFLDRPHQPLTAPTRKLLGDNRSLLLNLPSVIQAVSQAGFPDGQWPPSGIAAELPA